MLAGDRAGAQGLECILEGMEAGPSYFYEETVRLGRGHLAFPST